MRIQSSQVGLQASHVFRQRDERQESLLAWVGKRPETAEEKTEISPAARQLWLDSAAARQEQAVERPRPAHQTNGMKESRATETADEDNALDPSLSLVRQMIEMLTGEKVKVFDLRALQANQTMTSADTASLATAEQLAGYGVEYDFHALHEEFEQTNFSVQGQVVTADGQTINFSLNLQMSRSFREETNVSYREGDAIRKDPLVINFGGTAAQLNAQQTFRFDLDQDGHSEDLPTLTSGSGYLALDRNGNSKIDQASELFGPQTGNGFTELAALDEDGNGWIDEADSAYQSLQVWMPGAGASAGTLRSLAALDVGALGLARIQTPFALRGTGNEDLGVVRDTGVYLTNQGQVGSVQEVDLTV